MSDEHPQDDVKKELEDRLVDQSLQEAVGDAGPPDQSGAIVSRAKSEAPSPQPAETPFSSGRLVLAACLMLAFGLFGYITGVRQQQDRVARLERQALQRTANSAVTASGEELPGNDPDLAEAS
ncbi:MAG: hypothetical protein N2C14_10100, partial [Planctomycetales bacterium]